MNPSTREFVLFGHDWSGRKVEICIVHVLDDQYHTAYGTGYLALHVQSGLRFVILPALGRQWVTLYIDPVTSIINPDDPIDIGAPSPDEAIEALAHQIIEAEAEELRMIAQYN